MTFSQQKSVETVLEDFNFSNFQSTKLNELKCFTKVFYYKVNWNSNYTKEDCEKLKSMFDQFQDARKSMSNDYRCNFSFSTKARGRSNLSIKQMDIIDLALKKNINQKQIVTLLGQKKISK